MFSTIFKLLALRCAIVRGWQGPTFLPLLQVVFYHGCLHITIRTLLPNWRICLDGGNLATPWNWNEGTITDLSTSLAPWNRPRLTSLYHHCPPPDDLPF